MSRAAELAGIVRRGAARARLCRRHKIALDANGRICQLCLIERGHTVDLRALAVRTEFYRLREES